MNYRIFIVMLATIFVASCGKDQLCNCLKKTGDEITEVRSVSSFSSIEMNNNVDVIIIPDTFFSIKVTCGKNLMDGLKTEVKNNRLEIKILINVIGCAILKTGSL
ncbi:MAG: DUF2807 domain-containing protein [Bacteroidetes bacterium]|nr:DUF2807 domain-containing protein [Bacteroidota bacterium]